jgi:hypothetical protein
MDFLTNAVIIKDLGLRKSYFKTLKMIFKIATISHCFSRKICVPVVYPYAVGEPIIVITCRTPREPSRFDLLMSL